MSESTENTETTEQPEPVNAAPPEPPTPFAWSPPEGFEPVSQDFLIYSPDNNHGRACFGVLLDAIDIPRDKSTIKALVMLLIEATMAVDADGRVVEARAGQEVLVECSHFLRRLLRAAHDQKSVGELWLMPVGKLAAEGGDTITLWDIRGGKVYPREKFSRRGGAR